MKKTLLLACCFVATIGHSQTLQAIDVELVNTSSASGASITNYNSSQKLASCNLDTNQYTLSKATGLSALSINNATSALGISQYYNAPQALTISGYEFHGYKLDAVGGITQTVTVQMFLAGADSLPTGLPITTATVSVDTNFYAGNLALLKKTVAFFPTVVTQPYVIVVTNDDPNGIGLLFSDYNAADGADEWLAGVNIGGVWSNSYDIAIGGVPVNCDMIGGPYVKYTLDADFMAADYCLTTGTTTFTNNSSPINSDRMYNLADTIGSPELSYTWDYGDGSATENAISPSHTFPSIGYNADVMLTDTIFGWTSNCVTDIVIPVGDSINTVWASAVNGLSVDFTDLTYSPSAVATLLWDLGDGNTSTLQNPTHVYTMAGTYTVCLVTVNGCGSMDSSCQSVTVVACNNPIVDFSSIITGDQGDFTDGSTVTGTSTTWAWDFGDGNVSSMQNPSNTYATTGTYTVTLVVTDDCGTSSISYDIYVFVCTDPVTSFTVTDNEPSYDFTNTSATNGTTTYSWDMGDMTTYTTEDASHTYTANATYTVTLIVTDSCGVDSLTQDITVSIIGIEELGATSISVYPVPASDQITVESSEVIFNVEVLDLAGRSVLTQFTGANAAVLSTQSMANGEYLLKVNLSNGQNEVRRISVLH